MCDMNKKKIFAISDIHGFYDEMRNALAEAGFRENDQSIFLYAAATILTEEQNHERLWHI